MSNASCLGVRVVGAEKEVCMVLTFDLEANKKASAAFPAVKTTLQVSCRSHYSIRHGGATPAFADI